MVFDYNRFAYARLNPLRYNDPSGHAPQHPGDPDPDNAACATEWCWQNRWHRAHGFSWNGSGWTGEADAHFYDEGILSDVLGEAGIAFVTGWNWGSQQRQMSAIGQGVVALGQKLNRGLAGLRQLLGSSVSLHRLDEIPCQADACAPNQNVYYRNSFLNDSSSTWIAMTTVHELAHVVDWNSRIEVNGRMRFFSNAWHGAPITEYAASGVINRWERWAEAVTGWVYGDDYGVLLPRDRQRLSDLLNGWR